MIPEPTASELVKYDEEVKKQIGGRSNSVIEYSDPPNLLYDEARQSVKDMKQEDSESSCYEKAESKQA